MFAGNNNNSDNPAFPAFMEGNQFQYGPNASQMQLFRTILPDMNVNPISFDKNDQSSLLNRPNKKCRNVKDIAKQQMLQISLNNFSSGETCRPVSIPDTNAVSTGLRLFYDDDERNSSVTSASASMPALPIITSVGDNLRTEVDCHIEELDYYIRLQGEQFTKGMREFNRRHTASLLNFIEKDVCRRLREKEVELEDMNRKNTELVERINQLGTEAQSWHYRACYNKSMVNMLRSKLSKATAQGADDCVEGSGENKVKDAASSSSPNMIFAGISEWNNTVLSQHMTCKVCKGKEACMLLLGCRHLCLCEDCERFIDACPTCRAIKTSVIRVYTS